MIISVNWLKYFTQIDTPIDELATLVGARLVEIEEVIDLGKKYEGVVVAKVMSCVRHEDSDHLNITKLDDGRVTPDVERDENGYVQVVCGAPNVREGIFVAWLPPQSIVPETADDAEPFVLGSRKLRGVMSNGMIASSRELALTDEHDGILELDQELKDLKPGDSFAKAYELDDYLLDIENKSLTHRPDCFGIVGFAREVAAIQGKEFKTPWWLAKLDPEFIEKKGDIEAPKVFIDDESLSARYQAVVLSEADGSVKSSLQLQTYLARVGVRPINAIVDVTNYLMLVTGQPLHAFDYDKLIAVGGKNEIHVRAGRKGEKLELLDGREIELDTSDIVIAAGETAIGLAGAMGGASTMIDENTKNIIVESATFNLYNLRATQMRHGIFSEAITRFTKGQPAGLTAPVLAEAIDMMQVAGSKRASEVADCYPNPAKPGPIVLSVDKINGVLGTTFAEADVEQVLRNVEFETRVQDDSVSFTPPYWRSDIHIDEDVIEEIGRLSGFDEIEPTLPRRDFTAVRPSHFDQIRATIRKALVRAGANEVLTYSFVHGNDLLKAGQKLEDSYRIINSISPQLQYYRQSLTPSLLGAVNGNIRHGFENFALFEVNKVHPRPHGMTEENVPAEVDMVALVVASKKPGEGAPYYQAKKMLDYLGQSLGLDLVYAPIESDPQYPVTAPFEYRRSAMVTDRTTDTFLGIVGEYKKSVARGFKLPEYTAGFEIGSVPLLEAIQKLTTNYKSISRYPSTERDICFKVDQAVHYSQITGAINKAMGRSNLESVVTPVDIYQADGTDTKNVTLRVRLTPHDHTLTSEEVATVIDAIIEEVVTETNAVVV